MIAQVAIGVVYQFEILINVMAAFHLNSCPAILIATAIIKFEPNEARGLPIELTNPTLGTVRSAGDRQYPGLDINKWPNLDELAKI